MHSLVEIHNIAKYTTGSKGRGLEPRWFQIWSDSKSRDWWSQRLKWSYFLLLCKAGQLPRICLFWVDFCDFSWKITKKFKNDVKAWNGKKWVFRPAFECAQHTKAGWNTQHNQDPVLNTCKCVYLGDLNCQKKVGLQMVQIFNWIWVWKPNHSGNLNTDHLNFWIPRFLKWISNGLVFKWLGYIGLWVMSYVLDWSFENQTST